MTVTTERSYRTVKEAAIRLGISSPTVRRYMYSGILDWKWKNNQERLVLEDSIEALKRKWETASSHGSSRNPNR